MGVIKRGKKYWIEIMVNGKRIRESSPLNTKAGALAFEAELRHKIATGQPLKEVKSHELKDFDNYKEFCEAWLASIETNVYKYSELCNKKSFANRHLIPYFGKMALNQISIYDVDQFKALKSTEGLNPKTINNILTALSVSLSTAIDWKLIDHMPKIKLLKTPPSKYKCLSVDQLNLLLANVDGMLRDMIMIGAKCGLRFGEIIALTWDCVNFEKGEMEINKAVCRGKLGSTKSNKVRTVFIFGETIEMLKRRKRMSHGSNLVFTGATGGYPGQTNCRVQLHKACDKVGLARVGFHALRHSYGSHMNDMSANPVGIQMLMGHSDIKTTLRYIHPSKQFMIETARFIEQRPGVITAENNLGEK
jgi:integrase